MNRIQSGDMRPAKRRKLDPDVPDSESDSDPDLQSDHSETQSQADTEHNLAEQRDISPPPISRIVASSSPGVTTVPVQTATKTIVSPIHLTHVRDVPAADNVGIVSLRDILGDPMIKENWQFNYLHDIDYIMGHLDEDVRKIVQTRIVHGSWRREDSHRISLEKAAEQWPNVKLIAAHMPAFLGTHHSKMMILLRHDDCAQVVIHTANMISQDWTNLTQAVWRSPILPLAPAGSLPAAAAGAPIGSGERFKSDLLRYLDAYEGRLRPLMGQLRRHDFSSIRAALIASAPNLKQPKPSSTSSAWGWPGLQQALKGIPQYHADANSEPRIHVQVSSVGTLTEKWMNAFFGVLSTTKHNSTTTNTTTSTSTTFMASPLSTNQQKSMIRVIFPTEREVRQSLDGYASGNSIHMKLASKAQQKQFGLLKPMLCQWAGAGRPDSQFAETREAGRRLAAPHIKTYIRFSNAECNTIDWAMVTSANLSKQAWGEQPNKEGKVTIASYEIGVLVWPELFADGQQEKVTMCPTFKTDQPRVADVADVDKVVGFRMPYDLPLVPHGSDEVPWCAEQSHLEPDRHGVVWKTYEPKM